MLKDVTQLTLWRVAIALSGACGVGLAAMRYEVWWTALSQLASLAVALTYAGLAAYPHLAADGRREPSSPWLRGAMATLMVLVSGGYLVATAGDLSQPYSVFEHAVTPTLVLADYLFVGDNQRAVRWWHPLSWLVAPALYLGWYVVGDLGVYVHLDPSQPGDFAGRVGLLCLATLGAGFLLYSRGLGTKLTLGRSLRLPATVADH